MKNFADKDRVLNTFLELVQIYSPSFAERAATDHVKKTLEDLGYESYEDDAAAKIGGNTGNLIVSIPATKPSAPSLIIATHVDTVEPSQGVKPVVENGVVRSDGTTILGADDKTGVAAVIELAHVLKEQEVKHGPLHLVFTVCEEKGLRGAKVLDLEHLGAHFAYILDADGTVGRIITQSPYQNTLIATFHGKAAHAGVSPEKGINTVRAAAKAIDLMQLGRLDSESTANIGYIRGGTATNIVPDVCEVRGEARSHDLGKLNQQTAHMMEKFEEGARALGATVDIDLVHEYQGFKLSEEEKVVALAVETMSSVGLRPEFRASGGGSDTNVFNAKGLPSVNLAIGSANAHGLDEYQPIDALVTVADILITLIQKAASSA